jgi:hypothetical protein
VKLDDYYKSVLVPATSAVSAIRMAGLPLDRQRLLNLEAEWTRDLAKLEAYVTGEAANRGITLTYSEVHGTGKKAMMDFLYSARGLGLECKKYTKESKTFPNGQMSADDEALSWYASLKVPREDDHPIVTAILKIRSLSGTMARTLRPFLEYQRSDGAVHTHYVWNRVRTARLSSERPQCHNISEHADLPVSIAIKSCIVPRCHPSPTPEEWDPRKHGSVGRWDISGAEAAIRAAMLTKLFCHSPDPVAYDYIRNGKDIHSRTASAIYGVPEGTYTKGSWERDVVGKQSFFAKLFGGGPGAIKTTCWDRARMVLTDQEAQKISKNFDILYPGLVELYELDKHYLGVRGYVQDGYGRRRYVPLPEGAQYLGMQGGRARWVVAAPPKSNLWKIRMSQLEKAFHTASNSPTQSMNGTDNFFMLSLAYHGEYLPLKFPPMWADKEIPFPEAKAWRFHEGDGPGGKPLRAWHNNTVHDSGWLDCDAGHLEPAAKVIWRRCHAVPFDWRIKADVPYRVELKVGPDMGHLMPYNAVAKKFGLDLLPEL